MKKSTKIIIGVGGVGAALGLWWLLTNHAPAPAPSTGGDAVLPVGPTATAAVAAGRKVANVTIRKQPIIATAGVAGLGSYFRG